MTDFEIFKACFPEYGLTEELFDKLLEKENCTVFREDGGAAFVKNNKISLLMVAPGFQGRGVGKSLLTQCERHLSAGGYDYTYIGGIFPGLPESSKEYFEKNGYETQGSRVEMGMDIKDFSVKGNVPFGITFRFFNGKHTDLINAVGAVDKEWIQYFDDDSRVFCGFSEDTPVSFCIVDEDVDCLLSDGKARVGSIGCVGTCPEFRKRGIGLYMVELATEILKNKGCDKSFIHCTHLEDWYGKLGYNTFLRYCAARKKL